MTEERVTLAEGVAFQDLDTAVPGDPLLVISGTKHFQVGGLGKQILLSLGHDGCTLEEIRERIKSAGYEVTDEQLNTVFRKLIGGGMVNVPGITVPEQKQRRWTFLFHKHFALKIPILPARFIAPVTGLMARLLSPQWMAWLLPILLVTQSIYWYHAAPSVLGAMRMLRGDDFLYVVIFNYLALIFHEFGHASACRRFGIEHGPIGFGIYLVFPVFYADVSQAWRLKRSERMVVDGGGLYFTLLASAAATVVHLFTHHPVCAVLGAIFQLTVLANLNPFMRMDGYWLLSDALGIQNLMTTNRAMMGWLFREGLRRIPGVRKWVSAKAKPMIFGMSKRHQKIYLSYFGLFMVFTVFISYKFYFWYLPRLAKTLPAAALRVSRDYQLLGLSKAVFMDVFRLLVTCVPLFGLSSYLIRFGRKIVAAAGPVLRRRMPRVAAEPVATA